MRVKMAVKELLNRLKQLGAVVDSKATIPVYGYVRLLVGKEKSTLTGSDHRATLEITIKAESDSEGVILLPAKLTQEIITNQREQYMTLETASDTLINVAAGKYKAQLTTLSPDAFTVREEEGWEPRATMGLSALRSLIDRISFAVAADGKYEVSTALLDSTGKEIRLVGTNGHCMALASFAGDAGKFQLLLPKTALDLLDGVLEGGETVEVSESGEAFRFKTALETLTVQKTAGKFPAYERILPKEVTTQIKVDSDAFTAAVDCAIPLAEEGDTAGPSAILLFAASKSSLLVSASKSGSGLVNDDVAAISEGPDIQFQLSGALLKPFLDKISGELTINCIAPHKPIDFQSGSDYRFIITTRSAKEKTKPAGEAK